jgi:hypothetical protein
MNMGTSNDAAERFRAALDWIAGGAAVEAVTPQPDVDAILAEESEQQASESRRVQALLAEADRNAAANAYADRKRAEHLAEIRRQDHERERAEWFDKWGLSTCLCG